MFTTKLSMEIDGIPTVSDAVAKRLPSGQTSKCDNKLEPLDDMFPLAIIAHKLGHDAVSYAFQKHTCDSRNISDPYLKTMRRMMKYLIEKHQISFTSMAKKLLIDETANICRSFVIIADKMFKDRQINWGRIVTLYAFVASLVEYSVSHKIGENCEQKLGDLVSSYVADNLLDWIYQQGGWDAMVRYFAKEESA